MPREVPTCSSGKQGYRSPEAALNAANKEALRSPRAGGVPPGLRPATVAWYSYLCDKGCGMYHRTKNPPRVEAQPYTLVLPDVPVSARRPSDPIKDLDVVHAVVVAAIRKQGPGLRYPGREAVSKRYGISSQLATALRTRLVKSGLVVFRPDEGDHGVFRTSRPPVSLFE